MPNRRAAADGPVSRHRGIQLHYRVMGHHGLAMSEDGYKDDRSREEHK
jgi:hypothetical protein